jgi:hypothetical protein
VFTGLAADFCTILLYVFIAGFRVFSGVFGRFLEVTGAMYQSSFELCQLTMATIRTRKRTDGSASYTAQIRLFREGEQVYQESQTFARKQAAQAWVRKREAELDQPGVIERANRKGTTIKEMIDRYLVEMEKARPLGKTKRATLTAISATDFGQLKDSDINSQRLVDFALWRMSEEGGGVQPQTVGNDLVHFQGILARRPSSINMLQVTGFALFSTRR